MVPVQQTVPPAQHTGRDQSAAGLHKGYIFRRRNPPTLEKMLVLEECDW